MRRQAIFSPGFQERMGRERENAMRNRERIHSFDKDRAAILRDFPLAGALQYDSRGMGALSFGDFCRLCTTTDILYSKRELKSSRKALEREMQEYFLFLDADKDGLLCASDMDSRGFVGQDSRSRAYAWRNSRKGMPYGDMPNKAFPEHGRMEKEFMENKLGRINASLKKREAGGFCIYEYSLPVLDLPRELCGVKILHMSDIHFHEVAARKRNWLAEKVSERVRKRNEEKIRFLENIASHFPSAPDIVAVTGDFVVKGASDITERAFCALRGIFPSAIRFFTRGNDEHKQSHNAEITRAITEAGFEDITNRQKRLTINGRHINIAGVDDCVRGSPEAPLFASEHRIEPHFLFMHNLDALERKIPGHYDAVFWGHLHGFEPFGAGRLLLRLKHSFHNLNKATLGWSALSLRTFSYNSPGLGSHFPWRALGPAEGATIITLVHE